MKCKYSCVVTITIALLALSQTAWGVPASPRAIRVVNADGSMSEIRRYGDELHHYRVDERGVKRAETWFGSLSGGASEGVRRSSLAGEGMRISTFPTIGEKRALVILVDFADVHFSSVDDPNGFYIRMLNEKGFSHSNGAEGSVRDFYEDMSSGRFLPVFDVVGPIELPNTSSFYGTDMAGSGDVNAPQMIQEACTLCDGDVDFGQYDNDGDGIVDNVYVFYAGYGQADSPYDDLVWPHTYTLQQAGIRLTLDGVTVNRYSCSQELRYDVSGEKIVAGIGNFVHEFGHVLGLPDLYNTADRTDESSAYAWDTMSAGSYNNHSNTPPSFSSYERWVLGWLDASELRRSPDGSLSMHELQESGDAFRITVEGTECREYFFLENRQLVSWDAYLPYHGMLVWHVREDEKSWMTNAVNTDTYHHRIDIVEADQSMRATDRNGDSFPGAKAVTSFMLVSEGGEDQFLLDNISEEGGVIVLDAIAQKEWTEYLSIFGSQRPTSVMLTNVEEGSFGLEWTPVPETEYHSVCLSQLKLGDEQEWTSYGFDDRNDGMPEGWQATAQSYYSVKGYYGQRSPSLRLSESGDGITISSPYRLLSSVCFWARGKSDDAGKIVVETRKLFSEEWENTAEIVATTVADTHTISFDSVTDVRLRYAGGNNFIVVDDVSVGGYNWLRGLVSEKDTESCEYTFDNLSPGIYGVTIRGWLEGQSSLPSEELKVSIRHASGTGLENIAILQPDRQEDSSETVIYNLKGYASSVAAGQLPPAIYIRNNKKYIIK